MYGSKSEILELIYIGQNELLAGNNTNPIPILFIWVGIQGKLFYIYVN